MDRKALFCVLVITLQLTTTFGDDPEEIDKFVFHDQNCEANYHYDVNFFKCRLCDPTFNLVAFKESKSFVTLMHQSRSIVSIASCVCDSNSTEVYSYDNILKRPICEQPKAKTLPKTCGIGFVDATKFSSSKKTVRISHRAGKNNCTCDEKINEKYRNEYCIRKELLKDFKKLKTSTFDLQYIAFFCQVLHKNEYCNYLANLCVLSHYNIEENGACFAFYQQQARRDDFLVEMFKTDNELDGGEKMKPYIFFGNSKAVKTPLETPVEFPYSLQGVSWA